MQNCWIKADGSILPVANGSHAVLKSKAGHRAIRVSSPELRRTWWGIQANFPSDTALRTLRRLLRQFDGDGIRAELCGQFAEDFTPGHPTNIRKLLNSLGG